MTAMHITTLDTDDCGLPVKRRAWSLDKPDSVYPSETCAGCAQGVPCDIERPCPKGIMRGGIHQVLMFFLRKEDIAPAATGFDMFDRTDERRSGIEALLHLFLRGVQMSTVNLYDSVSKHLTQRDFPLDLYLEVVLSRPDDELPASEPDYDETIKRCAAENVQRTYSKRRTTASHLINGARSAAGSAVFGSADTSGIEFMKGFDDRDVIGYRIFACSSEAQVDIAASITEAFFAAKKQYDMQFGCVAHLNKEGVRIREATGPKGAPLKLNDVTRDDELHRLLCTNSHYIEAVFLYSRDESLKKQTVIKKCLSATKPIDTIENPINPATVFNPENYFASAKYSEVIDKRQADYSRYYDAKTRAWTFPLPNCVLVVPVELWEVSRFRVMYTPDSQKRTLEPRLDRGLPQKIAGSKLSSSSGVGGEGSGVIVAAAAADNASEKTAMDTDEVGGNGDDSEDGAGGGLLSSSDSDVAKRAEDASSDDDRSGATSSGEEDGDLGFMDDGASLGAADRESQIPDCDDSDQFAARARAHTRKVDQNGVALHDAPLPQSSNQRIDSDFMPTDHTTIDQSQPTDASSTTNKTQMHVMRSMYRHTIMFHIDGIDNVRERAFEYTAMQFRGIDEYMVKCMRPYSHISGPGRAINLWMQKAKTGPFGLAFAKPSHAFFDKKLSLFGTQVVEEFRNIDQVLCCYTSHADVFMCMISSMLSFWYALNRLRVHMMMHGEPATCKSFPIQGSIECMIAGTYMSLTSQSVQADAHDSDDSDITITYEEMQEALISKDSKNSEQVDALKEILTRGVLTRRRANPGNSGTMGARISVSEKHVVYLSACNLPEPRFNEAIRTRFVMRHHVKMEREDCTMDDKRNARERRDRDAFLKREYEKYVHNRCFQQAMHFHVEKMIMCGLLLEPSAIVFSIVYPIYKSVLESRFALSIGRRVGEQLVSFMHSMIIYHAIYRLYHSRTSPHYNDPSFSPWALVAINPMLKDSEEMVYFVLDLFKESFINLDQQAVVECIRDYYVKELCRDSTPQQIFRVVNEMRDVKVDTATSAAGVTQNIDSNSRGGGIVVADDSDIDDDDDDLQAPVVKVKDSMSSSVEYDWNYLPIRGTTMKKFASKISLLMTKMQMARRLQSEDVLRVLQNLSKSRVVSHPFKACMTSQAFPPVITTSGVERPYAALRVSADGNTILIHSMLAFGQNLDPHQTAIAACFSSSTPFATYISALPVRDGLPHILNVRNVGPIPHTPLVEPLPHQNVSVGFSMGAERTDRAAGAGAFRKDDSADSHSNEEETAAALKMLDDLSLRDEASKTDAHTAARLAAVHVKKRTLLMSYDEYATMYRLQQLAMPVTATNVSRFAHQSDDKLARTMPGAVLTESIAYPGDVIGASNNASVKSKLLGKRICNLGKGDINKARRENNELAQSFEMLGSTDVDGDEDDEKDVLYDLRLRILRESQEEVARAPCNQDGFAERRAQEEAQQRALAEADAKAREAQRALSETHSKVASIFTVVQQASSTAHTNEPIYGTEDRAIYDAGDVSLMNGAMDDDSDDGDDSENDPLVELKGKTAPAVSVKPPIRRLLNAFGGRGKIGN